MTVARPGRADRSAHQAHQARPARAPHARVTGPERPGRRRAGALIAAALAAPALPARAQSAARTVRTTLATLEVAEFARGLQNPWGLAFLPEGRMLVTERPGRLRLVEPDGRLSVPLAGVPTVVGGGQAGLLGVVLSPAFATDRTLFLSYAERTPAGGRTAVARAEFDGTALRDVRTIFRQQPDASGGNHWGGQMVFDRDGLLFVTLGDRFSLRDKAQDLGTHLGKIVRIRPDGSVPPDNPFVGRAGALPEIWSYGHRNVQGAALHPSTGRARGSRAGPQGGDELNVALAGRNYGWPVVTFGREYGTGFRIGEGSEKPGMVSPMLQWTPSIAPSGMAFYEADRIPGWKGQLLVGALAYRSLYRLELDGEKVVRQERMLESIGRRIRDVRVGPDGLVYLLTDEPEGAILRLSAG